MGKLFIFVCYSDVFWLCRKRDFKLCYILVLFVNFELFVAAELILSNDFKVTAAS